MRVARARVRGVVEGGREGGELFGQRVTAFVAFALGGGCGGVGVRGGVGVVEEGRMGGW